jgi:hypothetical protein
MAWAHARRGDYEQGDYESALEEFQTVAGIYDHVLGNTFGAGSERQRKASTQTPVVYLHEILTLISEHFAGRPDAERAAFDMILRRKGIVAEALAVQRDTILGGRHPDLMPQLQALTAQRAEIARLLLDVPDTADMGAYKRHLDALEENRERLEADLARVIPELNLAETFRTADTAAVAAALTAGHALVEFVRFPVCAFQAPREGKASAFRYLAFVLPAGLPDGLRMIDLGDAVRIDGLIARFRDAVIRGSGADRNFELEASSEKADERQAGRPAQSDLRFRRRRSWRMRLSHPGARRRSGPPAFRNPAGGRRHPADRYVAFSLCGFRPRPPSAESQNWPQAGRRLRRQ